MVILDLIGTALKTIGSVVGGSEKVKAAIATIEETISSNDALKVELAKAEIESQRVLVSDSASLRLLYAEELKSNDKFIARVRPAAIWLVLAVVAMNFVLLPLFNTIATYFGYQPVVVLVPTLPDEFYWLAGSMFGIYTGARSWDKKNAVVGGK